MEIERIINLSRKLEREGYKDILFLTLEDARAVLTEKRMELIKVIKESQIDSIRDLARKVNRPVSVVHGDLKILASKGVIEFKKEKNRLKPVIRHENIFILPLVLKRKPMPPTVPIPA